jgi:predicted PurR-regulated permease PerM
VFLLRASGQLLIPIVIAVLISYALEPVVAWLERLGLPRMAGAALLLAVILGATAWGVYSLRDDAMEAMEALPRAAERARSLLASGGQSGPVRHVRDAAEVLQGAPGNTEGTTGEDAGQGRAQSGNRDDPAAQSGGEGTRGGGGTGTPGGGAIGSLAQRAIGSVFSLVGHVTVILFLVFFLLTAGRHFRTRLLEIAGPRLERRRITAKIIDEIDAQIQRFLLVRLFTSAVVAAATWGVLALMGVGQAAVWGILAGVFNSIPYFGPVIVSGGLLVVGLVQSGDTTQAFKMAGAALAITTLEGWLLTPPLLGKTERMHVIVVFLGVLVWTWIWGAWGTILAVPMLVVLKAAADHLEPLRPLGRLMAP